MASSIIIGPPLRAQLNVRIPTDLRRQLDDYVSVTGEQAQDVAEAALRAYFAAHPLPAAAAAPPRRRRAVAGDGQDGGGVGVSLPMPLVERLRAHARQTGRNYTDVALDAVEATRARLAAVLLAAAAPAPAPAAGTLFSRRPSRPRVPHQQVNLRFSEADLAVVDELWPRVGAPSRSAMLAAALDGYLPKPRADGFAQPAG